MVLDHRMTKEEKIHQNNDVVGILREGSDYKKLKEKLKLNLVMSVFLEESVAIIVLGKLMRKC